MTCVKGVKAVLARTMFSLHAVAALWRLVSQGTYKQRCIVIVSMSKYILDGDKFTKIGIGVIIQILEGLHALCYRFVIILSSQSPSSKMNSI